MLVEMDADDVEQETSKCDPQMHELLRGGMDDNNDWTVVKRNI